MYKFPKVRSETLGHEVFMGYAFFFHFRMWSLDLPDLEILYRQQQVKNDSILHQIPPKKEVPLLGRFFTFFLKKTYGILPSNRPPAPTKNRLLEAVSLPLT